MWERIQDAKEIAAAMHRLAETYHAAPTSVALATLGHQGGTEQHPLLIRSDLNIWRVAGVGPIKYWNPVGLGYHSEMSMGSLQFNVHWQGKRTMNFGFLRDDSAGTWLAAKATSRIGGTGGKKKPLADVLPAPTHDVVDKDGHEWMVAGKLGSPGLWSTVESWVQAAEHAKKVPERGLDLPEDAYVIPAWDEMDSTPTVAQWKWVLHEDHEGASTKAHEFPFPGGLKAAYAKMYKIAADAPPGFLGTLLHLEKAAAIAKEEKQTGAPPRAPTSTDSRNLHEKAWSVLRAGGMEPRDLI